MQIVVLILFLLFTAWISTEISVFIPLNIFAGIQNIFWYLFLGVLIIVVSWLMGE